MHFPPEPSSWLLYQKNLGGSRELAVRDEERPPAGEPLIGDSCPSCAPPFPRPHASCSLACQLGLDSTPPPRRSGSRAYFRTSCSLQQGLRRQRMKSLPKAGWNGQFFLLSSRQSFLFLPLLHLERGLACFGIQGHLFI